MDGNGRWAKLRGLPRSAGHKIGAKTFQKITRYCNQVGIKYLTVYAFSTENWARPKEEVDALMSLFREYLKDAHNFADENVKVQFIGDRSAFDDDIISLMEECEKESADFTGLHLNIALNYGGRDEIIHAAKTLYDDIASGKIKDKSEINKKLFSSYLYTSGQPDVDLIIRPSGEYRLSNFMIWQSAYAEYVFMDILWPDFTEKALDKALDEFAKRNRRFGGV